MPPVGLIVGGVDFTDLTIIMKAASGGAPAVMFKYGRFIQTVVDFTIVAFAIFLLVKAINALKRKEEAAVSAPPGPSKEETLLTEIRDILRSK